jgi:hypothetical protein
VFNCLINDKRDSLYTHDILDKYHSFTKAPHFYFIFSGIFIFQIFLLLSIGMDMCSLHGPRDSWTNANRHNKASHTAHLEPIRSRMNILFDEDVSKLNRSNLCRSREVKYYIKLDIVLDCDIA